MKTAALALWLGTACVIALATPAMFQDRLLYFPAKAAVADMVSAGLEAWPARADFRGLVAQPSGAPRGTAIVFHGNAGHAGDRAFYADTLTRQGLRVILAEYPGYGPRDGAVGERSLVDDAAHTIALAHRQYGGPLLVIGESLGAGVASAAVARQRDTIAGLMLITPWDRLAQVTGHHYPWLPVTWLLRDQYDSAAHLASIGRPVLVVVAERDRTVPARFGHALYDALPQPKRLTVIATADHNDWPRRTDTDWWRHAIAFLLGDPAAR